MHLILLVVGFAAAAAQTAPGLAENSGPASRVGVIWVERTNVFDPSHPDENRPPYTWVNKLHIVTRESVIRRELLLKPGDTFDPYLLGNSERNLRGRPFVKDVEISSRPGIPGEVDLLVRTQDTWTTDIAPSIGTVAGDKKLGLLFRERNFLGRGKTLELNYADGFGQISRRMVYLDPRIGGTKYSAKIAHTDHSRGYDTEASVGLPAYSLIAPFSFETGARHSADVVPIYKDGSEKTRLRMESQKYEATAGHPIFGTTSRALRSTYGYNWIDRRFASSTTASGTELAPARKLSMFEVLLTYQVADYIKENRVNKFERYEDINLGLVAQLRLGYSAKKAGATQDELLPWLTLRKGVGLGPGRFVLAGTDMYGVYANSRAKQVIETAHAAYYHKDFFAYKNTLVLHAEASRGLRLFPDSQLILGGTTGLRGYRREFFTGNSSLLLNAESRLYLVEDWLHVLSLAPIVFWDAGYVWPSHQRRSFSDLKHDVGLGLRIGFTRSATNPVVRMDLSYALNKEGTVKSRLVFSVGIHHAFDLSYNALKRVSMD